MAYQVDKFNGTFLVSVDDGTIDTTTDLRFVGKNYAGYGELQNENFLHLLENFANNTAPPKVITGQIWFDSSTKRLRYFDGSRFKVAGGAEVSDIAPSGLSEGDFWWDRVAKQLYAWSGTEFSLIGPEASPELGQSTVSFQDIRANDQTIYSVLKLNAGGETVAVVSRSEFTIADSEINGGTVPTGFLKIRKGITLKDVESTNNTGVSQNNYFFWGSAADSLRLGGRLSQEFLVKTTPEFPVVANFVDAGFRVGGVTDLIGTVLVNSKFNLRIDNSDNTILENLQGNSLFFRITEGQESRNPLELNRTGLLPGANNFFDIGSSVNKWKDIYATRMISAFQGDLTGNSTGVHKGNVISTVDNSILVNADTKVIGQVGATLVGNLVGTVEGTITGTADNANTLGGITGSVVIPVINDKTSIVIRNGTGNIFVNQVIGTSDRADRIRIDNAATDPIWNSGTVSTQYRTAKTTATAYSIAARDSEGNLSAVLFQGTATAARYADLAEKYLPDADYETGTVVVIGGEKEITASSWGQRAIGVISSNPAYMMNSELEGGVYVALKGRVPVKVTGAVQKGQRLIAANDGCAMAAVPHANDVFAIALESSDDIGIKLIEAVVL